MWKTRQKSPRRSGFTLVEVLVALLILSLVAVLAWRGVDSMVRSRDASGQSVDATLRSTTVLAQLETDLAAMLPAANVPALAFDGLTLRLARRAEGGVQFVAWRLNAGQWQRWASVPSPKAQALQQAWFASQQLLGNEPGTVTMLEGVSAAQFFFYRNNAWTNAQSTGDVAAAPNLPAPPASPSPGASAPGAAAAAAAPREVLPNAVRLVLTLPAGTLTRDWLIASQGGS